VPSRGSAVRRITCEQGCRIATLVLKGATLIERNWPKAKPQRLTPGRSGPFEPTPRPQKEAGWRIERRYRSQGCPYVQPAATAAALPPELPPGPARGPRDWRLGAKAEVSVELAHGDSSRCFYPSHPAGPLPRGVRDGGFVGGGTKFSSMRPGAGGANPPWWHEVSLIASGQTPAEGGKGSPAGQAGIDAVLASARARSAVTCRKAWTGGVLRP